MPTSLPTLTLPQTYPDGRTVGHGVRSCDAETSGAVFAMLDGWTLDGATLASMSDDARVSAYVYAVDMLADGVAMLDAVRRAKASVRNDALDAVRRAARSDSLDGVGPTALDIPDARPTAPDHMTRATLADLLDDAATLAMRDADVRRGMIGAAIILGHDASGPFGAVWHDARGMATAPRRAALAGVTRLDVSDADVRRGVADAADAIDAARAAWQARQTGARPVWTDADILSARLARLATAPAPAAPSATPVSSYGAGPASVVTEHDADARRPHIPTDCYAVAPWQGDTVTRDADRFATRDAWRPGRVATPSRRSGRRGQTGPTVPVRLSR